MTNLILFFSLPSLSLLFSIRFLSEHYLDSIGWANKTKSYFEEQFKDRNIDFKKFANRVTDVKGSTDAISVMNKNPLGKIVFIKSEGHYPRDFDLNQFVREPDTKYYLWVQMFAYIGNYLSEIKDPVERDEKINTILEAFDYNKNGQQTNVFGDDITTYRTKIFIIVLWVLFKSYVKVWIVVYVLRMKSIINNNPNELITSFPNEEQGSFIDNIKAEKPRILLSDIDSSRKIQPI